MKMQSGKKIKTQSNCVNILIAQSFWQDKIFSRSVILIFDHDEHGSTGIILNKSSQLDVNAIYPNLEIHTPLFYGGPFSEDLVGFIHDYPFVEDAIPIGNGLYWCGDMEDVKQKTEQHIIDADRLKFFSGFVQWAPGQLYKEIKENKWWINTLNINDILKIDFKKLWAYSLLKKGNAYGLLYAVADPVLN
jgi:putative transcriptional regulator